MLNILFSIIISITIFSCGPKDDTWEMLAPGLPHMVSTKIAPINMGYYILKQTHEPLFRIHPATNQYTSRILRDWKQSFDNKIFLFCPNKDIHFYDSSFFTTDVLLTHLKFILPKFSSQPSEIKKNSSCIEIEFKYPQPTFLKFLSLYENAPTKSSSNNSNVEFGLGPFYATLLNQDTIVLKRRVRTNRGFNKIKILRYQGISDANLNNRAIEDFNRLPVDELQDWIIKNYQEFDATLLKTFNLIINHPNSSIRNLIYHCSDIQTLRKAFVPRQKTFYDIANHIPVGLPGASNRPPDQNCPHHRFINKSQTKTEITFLNWRTDNTETLNEYFREFGNRYHLNIAIQPVTLNELITFVLKKPHPYHLVIIALNATEPSYDPFYKYFLDPKTCLIDITMPKANSLYSLLRLQDFSHVRLQSMKALNDEFSKNAVVLPLYQEIRPFYYPKRIKNLKIGLDSLEYPEIADLKI